MKLRKTNAIVDSSDYREFTVLLARIKHDGLRGFLKWWFNPQYLFGRRFFTVAAATTKNERGHHNYEGGLAYHSIHAAKLGIAIVEHYKSLNLRVSLDLVIAGILLHDIGKAWCYRPKNIEQTEWVHTQDSKLFHHIPIGHREFCKAVDKYEGDIGEDNYVALQHIILSHHGEKRWSSPVVPQTPEAYIVHAVEMMDGKLEGSYFRDNPPRELYSH